MNREEYWKKLEEQDFIGIYFQYWREFRTTDYAELSESDFRELWNIFIGAANGRGVHTPNGVKAIDADRIREKVFHYYANKYV